MTGPQAKFRVLLVDDSSVVRRVLTDLVSSDPGLEVIGTAPEGRTALKRIEQLKPDLMVLDVEMPEMDGLATLTELRKTNRNLPVIMFSTLTHRGATATLDALTLGADDYVPKERNTLGLAASMEDLRGDLLPKIHALCLRNLARQGRARPELRPQPQVVAVRPQPRPAESTVDVLVVGVSTGGPDALCRVLPGIPRDLPVPVVMVQHMPAVFTRLLAERLTLKSPMPVKEAAGGETLMPGTIWLAPGGQHMTVRGSRTSVHLELDMSPPRNFCRPSVDVLLESAAGIYGAGTLATILTGMGSDGLHGCEMVRKIGGQVVAQDEETSVVWGMPGAVVRAGVADAVRPLTQIADEIVQRVMRRRTRPQASTAGARARESAYVQPDK
jgi:two-component system, chemotaxis family, protein-glutamate methylesterase/glutaminase